MKKITLKLISILCAVCMIMPVSIGIFAAENIPSVWVQTRETSDKSAVISLVNVTYQIYSAQVTLKVNGEDMKFEITPEDNSVYGTITQTNDTVTLYIDSTDLMEADAQLNNQDVINLAVLKADKTLKIGDSADLILIDRSMKSHSYDDVNVKITVLEPSSTPKPSKPSGGGGGGGGGSVISRPDSTAAPQPDKTEDTNQTNTNDTNTDNTNTDTVDTGFIDVPGDFWANESIRFVTERGLFAGTSENTFDPHAQMTRGMYVTVLSRFGEKLGEDWSIACDNPAVFNDIAGDEWFAAAAAWAGGTGIVNGIEEGIFGPYYPITREQIAVMTMTFANLCGKELPMDEQPQVFSDDESINDWARDAVTDAQRAGLIYGREDGTFAPQATATRSEVAAILMRFIQNVK